MQTLCNPWNAMPGWRFPGLAEDSIAPSITLFNRGVFDAQGLPYAFELVDMPGGNSHVLRRVLRTNGQAGFEVEYFVSIMREQFGDDGEEQAYRMLNDQFCWARNSSFSAPPPFWIRSPQVHPLWISEDWILTCNSNKPPGFAAAEIPATSRPGTRPWPSEGNDLRRWSLYPTDAPRYSGGDPYGSPLPYPLYQTTDAGQAETLPADIYRSPQPVFHQIMLEGISEENYAETVYARPINV